MNPLLHVNKFFVTSDCLNRSVCVSFLYCVCVFVDSASDRARERNCFGKCDLRSPDSCYCGGGDWRDDALEESIWIYYGYDKR